MLISCAGVLDEGGGATLTSAAVGKKNYWCASVRGDKFSDNYPRVCLCYSD